MSEQQKNKTADVWTLNIKKQNNSFPQIVVESLTRL